MEEHEMVGTIVLLIVFTAILIAMAWVNGKDSGRRDGAQRGCVSNREVSFPRGENK